MFDGSGFTFHDTVTATAKARTEPVLRPKTATNFWGAALRADGTRFVSLYSVYSPKSETFVAVWDVATGKRVSTTPTALVSASGCGWWGPDHLLLYKGGQASAEVFSIQTAQVVASLQSQGGRIKIAAATPGDKLWYVIDGSSFDRDRAAPVLVKLSPPAAFRATKFTIGPDGLREASR
jgi:hypothetical protein